jgi:hypothetical protein
VSTDAKLSIRQYPNLNFIIIINPASGPGASSSPDGNYTREIPQLNAHTNVQTVGYVATGYATRSLDDVFQDIKTYATWRDNKSVPGLGMDGIFLDETPNAYSSASFDFVSAIDKNVRSSEGWGTNGMVSKPKDLFPQSLQTRILDVMGNARG